MHCKLCHAMLRFERPPPDLDPRISTYAFLCAVDLRSWPGSTLTGNAQSQDDPYLNKHCHAATSPTEFFSSTPDPKHIIHNVNLQNHSQSI